MSKIISTKHGDILVDDDIYELIKDKRIAWYGKYPMIRLHHLVAESSIGEGICVDHIDGNTSNAQRHNLRVCTKRQNQHNTPKQKIHKGAGPSSQYIGVTNHKQTKKWRMRLTTHRETSIDLYDAKFDSEIEAARVRDICAIAERGEFASLNFPLSDYADIDCESEAKKYKVGRQYDLRKKPSPYRGVQINKQGICASIGGRKNRVHLGKFESEIEAAKAYDSAAKQRYGDKAKLNFPTLE